MFRLWTEEIIIFEDLLHAIAEVRRSGPTFNFHILKEKLKELYVIQTRDREYLMPSYYIAMFEDTLGNFETAETILHELNKNVTTKKLAPLSLEIEIRISQAIVKYHIADPSRLIEAEDILCRVINEIQESCPYRGALREFGKRTPLRAEAILAQVHATPKSMQHRWYLGTHTVPMARKSHASATDTL